MPEPSNPEDSNQTIKKAFSRDTSPDDRATAFDKIIADALKDKKRNTLSEDDPDKVVKAYSHLDEERAMKGFNYCMQRLEGKTSIWNEMIKELKPGDRKEITGVIFKDNSVVWSDEAVAHMHLVNAANKEYSDNIGQIQTQYALGSSKPQLWIYSDDQEAINRFQSYLQRNVDPQIPLSVWASPIRTKSFVQKHELNIRKV